MSMIRFRSLSQIFLLGVAFISVPLLAGTVLTFIYIERLSADSRRLVVRSLEIGRETEKLIGHIEELNRTARQYMVVGDEELHNLYIQKHFRLIDTLEWLELLVSKKEARQLLDDIRSVSDAAFDEMQRQSDSPGQITEENFEKLVQLSDDLRFFASTAIQTQLDTAANKVETARVVLYWIWGISSLFIVAFVGVFAWFISKPIRQMDAHIRRLGQGDFGGPIRIEGPTDIAELGDRLDWLRLRLGEIDYIKEQFFREMSHQLKTPLASIRESSGLLMDESGRLDEKNHREVLELLHDNSIELQRMLDNMLNFSAWRAEPGKLYRESFDLRKLLDNIVQRFRAPLLTHDLNLVLECPAEMVVDLDREKCRVILDNLISNAVKFSPEGGAIVVNATRNHSDVTLDVSDEGPGVPVEDRERIFELFYLGDRPSGSRVRGTGVGLSLVKAYVEAHNGSVYVESRQNSGAWFRVVMPQK